MQKIQTQNNLEQQQREHKHTNKKIQIDQPKKHKLRTENIPPKTDQPRKHRKRIKRQTK